MALGVLAAAVVCGTAVAAYGYTRLPAHSTPGQTKVRTGEWKASRQTSPLGTDLSTTDGTISAASAVKAPARRGVSTHSDPCAGIQRVPRRLMTRSPRGHLYGTVVYYEGMTLFSEAYWGEIDVTTGVITPLFNGSDLINGVDSDVQTGAVRDGILYTPVCSQDMSGGLVVYWNRRDLATGDVLTPVNFGLNDSAYAYSMCYDPDDDLFHVLTVDPVTGTFGIYAQVTPDTWEVKTFGRPGGADFLGAIGYNPADGQVYVVSDANMLSVIDEATYTLTAMAEIDDYFQLVQNGTTTPMTYSPLDGSFALQYRDEWDGNVKLAFLDPETGEVYEGEVMTPGAPWVSCLYSPDAYAVAEAPEMPAMPVVSFEGASLDGTVTFAAPAYSYGGVRLDDSTRLMTVLTVDGEEIFKGELAPGEQKTVSLQTAPGLHEASLQCFLAGETSPARIFRFPTGADQPRTPAGLTSDRNVLTWQPVEETGANGGYIAPGSIRYNVYSDGVLQNTEPLAETTFTLSDDRALARSEVSVKAVSSGLESAPASLSMVYGRPLTLPVNLQPTREEASLFTTLNVNNDRCFFAYRQNDASGEWAFTIWLDRATGDDWLFMPAAMIDSTDMLYSLTFGYSGSSPYETLESLEVCLGRRPTPEAMTERLYSHTNFMATYQRPINTVFPVSETGEWYVGFHCISHSGDALGMTLTDFKLEALSDRSSAAPASPEVKISSAPGGELKAVMDITLATEDLTGNRLPDGECTVEVASDDFHAVGKGRPGETVTVDVEVGKSGFNDLKVTPSNAAGTGLTTVHRAYIGLDRPLPPRNIRKSVSADNLSLTLTWDAPESVGVNGGYVDTENLGYIVYQRSGVATNELNRTDKREYTYTVYSNVPDSYEIGPSAYNAMGQSAHPAFPVENLGRPHAIPMVERFAGIFVYNPLRYTITSGYENSRWEALNSIGALGTGATVDCNGGCLAVYNNSNYPCLGELVLPKGNTTAAEAVSFRMRWLDWRHTPRMSVWGRRYGQQELEQLAVFEPNRPINGVWRDEEVALPAGYADCPWVEMRVRAELTDDYDEVGFLDSYSLVQDVSHDLKIASIDAPASMENGEVAQALVTVLNAGTENMNGMLHVTVTDGNGAHLEDITRTISRLLPNQTYLEYVDIEVAQENVASGRLVIEATVESAQDVVSANNTMTAEITLTPGMAPCVSDLHATWNGEDETQAMLVWSTPNLSHGGYDGFEYQEPFALTEELGMWRNYDLDGEVPFLLNGLRWPNDEVPSAWQVIDAAALSIPGDDRIAPRNGNMYIMARAISVDIEGGEEPIQANDWLISPEVIGGTQVTFWYNTLSPEYMEYVELWISETDRNIDSFYKRRTFSKDGDEDWEEVRFTLPENARYFALVYRSFDAFGALLDDISFVPAHLEQWVVDHYMVMRSADGKAPVEVARVEDGTQFADIEIAGKNQRYWVKTAVKTGSEFRYGPRSNTASLDRVGIDDLRDLEGVTGGKGVINIEGLFGQTLSVYTADGRHQRQVTVPSDHARVGMEPGIYLVKCGNALAKVLVK